MDNSNLNVRYNARVDLMEEMDSTPQNPVSTGTMTGFVKDASQIVSSTVEQTRASKKLFTSMSLSNNICFTHIVCNANGSIQIYNRAFIFKCED